MTIQLTINISEDLASKLGPLHDRLPHILALGLREMSAEDGIGFKGTADVLEVLAGLPTPEEILALRPTPVLQENINDLLEKNRKEGLNAEEEWQWRQYEYLEHLVRKAKINAQRKLVRS